MYLRTTTACLIAILLFASACASSAPADDASATDTTAEQPAEAEQPKEDSNAPPSSVTITGSSDDTPTDDQQAPKASVSYDELDVTGSFEEFDNDIAKRVLRKYRRETSYCYDQSLKNAPDLEGTLHAEATLADSGEVETATIERGTLTDPDLESCLQSKISHWDFPKPKKDDPVTVTFTLKFWTSAE